MVEIFSIKEDTKHLSFTTEIYNLLIRYTKDLDGRDITLAELQNLAWWRCVWGSWRAKAYYKMGNYFERFEDVPEGLTDYTIMTPKLKTQYFVLNGSNIVQEMTVEDCKSIYS